MTRFIFVTGGVVSSLGKGLSASAIAVLLQDRGYKVKIRKLDPYLNVDAGTMSPTQHGEVFVTDDGAEADLDLGYYERFTGISACKDDIITSGKIYQKLLKKERRGDYLGATVQVVPHITNLIKEFITNKLEGIDFIIYEIGGTVGDIEGLPFYESIRQIGYEYGKAKVLFVHLTLVPYLKAAKEVKTKPTQHSVRALCSIGIQPDILLCRTSEVIPEKAKQKIATFCNIDYKSVIEAKDVESIYQIPINYYEKGLDNRILELFGLPSANSQLDNVHPLAKWKNIINIEKNTKHIITVAVVGKYTELTDAYKSIIDALSHAGIANSLKVKIKWVDSYEVEDCVIKELSRVDAIIVPGGFGKNGTEGKISAIKYARINKVPILGICYGMQLMLIEFARNVLNLDCATTAEYGDGESQIIILMESWQKSNSQNHDTNRENLGGTMRIGAYKCILEPESKAFKIYGKKDYIFERHRHRYEANIDYEKQFNSNGLFFSGFSTDKKLPEIAEIREHPWFIGVQFHPELKSRPHDPHPLFVDLVKKAGETVIV